MYIWRIGAEELYFLVRDHAIMHITPYICWLEQDFVLRSQNNKPSKRTERWWWRFSCRVWLQSEENECDPYTSNNCPQRCKIDSANAWKSEKKKKKDWRERKDCRLLPVWWSVVKPNSPMLNANEATRCILWQSGDSDDNLRPAAHDGLQYRCRD